MVDTFLSVLVLRFTFEYVLRSVSPLSAKSTYFDLFDQLWLRQPPNPTESTHQPVETNANRTKQLADSVYGVVVLGKGAGRAPRQLQSYRRYDVLSRS